MGSAIGSGIFSASQTVSHHAANTAFAVGDIVGDHAERLVATAVDQLPAYNKYDLHELNAKNNVLLNELSKTYFLLRTEEEKQAEMKASFQSEMDAACVREGVLARQLQQREIHLAELQETIDELKEEGIKQSADMDFLMDESKAEVSEWKRIAEDHKSRCERLLVQSGECDSALERVRDDLEHEKKERRADQGAWQERIDALTSAHNDAIAGLELDLQNAKEHIDAVECARNSHAAELEVLRDLLECDKAKSSAEYARVRDQLARQQATSQQIIVQKDESLSSAHEVAQMDKQQIEELQKLLKVSADDRLAANERITTMESECNELRQGMLRMQDIQSEKDSQIVTLSQQLSMEKESSADAAASAATRIIELESALRLAQTQASELDAQLQAANACSAETSAEFRAELEGHIQSAELVRFEYGSLRKDLEERVEICSQMEAKVASLEMCEAKLTAMLENKSSDLDTSNRLVMDLERDLEASASQICHLTTKVGALEGSLQDHADGRNALQVSLASAESALEDANQKLAVTAARTATLTADLGKLEALSSDKDQQDNALKQSLESLRVQLDEATGKLSSAEELNRSLSASLSSRTEDTACQERTIADLTHSLNEAHATFTNSIREITEAKNAAEASLQACQEDLANKVKKVNLFQSVLREMHARVKQLTDLSRGEATSLRRDVAAAGDAHMDLLRQTSMVSMRFQALLASAEEDARRANSFHLDAENRRDEALKRVEEAEKSVGNLERRCEEISETAAKKDAQLTEANAALRAMEGKYVDLHEQYSAQSETLRAIQVTLSANKKVSNENSAEVVDSLQKLGVDYAEISAELEARTDKLASVEASFHSGQAELIELRKKIAQCESDAMEHITLTTQLEARIQSSLEGAAADKERYGKDVNDLQKIVDDLHERLACSEQQAAQKVALEAQLSELKATCIKEKSTHHEAIASLQNELSIATGHADALQMTLSDRDVQCAASQASQAELVELRKRYAETRKAHTQMVESLSTRTSDQATEKELEKAKRKVGELTTLLYEVRKHLEMQKHLSQQKDAEVDSAELKMAQQSACHAEVLAEAKLDHEMDVENLDRNHQVCMADMQSRIDEALSAKSVLINTISELEGRLAETTRELSIAEECRRSIGGQCDELQSDYDRMSLEYTTRVTSLMTEKAELADSLSEHSYMLAEMRKQDSLRCSEMAECQRVHDSHIADKDLKIAQLNADLVSARLAAQVAAKQYDELLAEYNVSKAEVSIGEQKLNEYSREVGKLQHAINCHETSAKDAEVYDKHLQRVQAGHSRVEQEIREELQISRSQIAALQNELANTLQRLNMEHYDGMEKHGGLVNELNEARCRFAELQSVHAKLLESEAFASERVSELETELTKSRNDSAAAKQELDALTHQLNELLHYSLTPTRLIDIVSKDPNVSPDKLLRPTDCSDGPAVEAPSDRVNETVLEILTIWHESVIEMLLELHEALVMTCRHASHSQQVASNLGGSLHGDDASVSESYIRKPPKRREQLSGLSLDLKRVSTFLHVVHRRVLEAPWVVRSGAQPLHHLPPAHMSVSHTCLGQTHSDSDDLQKCPNDASENDENVSPSEYNSPRRSTAEPLLVNDAHMAARKILFPIVEESCECEGDVSCERDASVSYSTELAGQVVCGQVVGDADQAANIDERPQSTPVSSHRPPLGEIAASNGTDDSSRECKRTRARDTLSAQTTMSFTHVLVTDLVSEIRRLNGGEKPASNASYIARLTEIILMMKAQDEELHDLRREICQQAAFKKSCSVLKAVVKLTVKAWKRARETSTDKVHKSLSDLARDQTDNDRLAVCGIEIETCASNPTCSKQNIDVLETPEKSTYRRMHDDKDSDEDSPMYECRQLDICS
jgi:chromosome segregation ATPase